MTLWDHDSCDLHSQRVETEVQTLWLGFPVKNQKMTHQHIPVSYNNFSEGFLALSKEGTQSHMPSGAQGCMPRCQEQDEVRLLTDFHLKALIGPHDMTKADCEILLRPLFLAL